jgi:hypothetical protein
MLIATPKPCDVVAEHQREAGFGQLAVVGDLPVAAAAAQLAASRQQVIVHAGQNIGIGSAVPTFSVPTLP